jgi:hypothetical protein
MMIYDDIEAERGKQIKKGWTAEHDDGHEDGALAIAAGCLAIYSATGISPKHLFPWDDETLTRWTEKPQRSQLIIASALLVAEIERLDREALSAGQREGGS